MALTSGVQLLPPITGRLRADISAPCNAPLLDLIRNALTIRSAQRDCLSMYSDVIESHFEVYRGVATL
jgi:hypothetical protein